MQHHDVRIVGLTLRDREQKSGNVELAFFDVQTNAFVIRSCAILLFPNGHVGFASPRLASNRDQHAVDISDRALRTQIINAAIAAYRALGGAHDVTPRAAKADDAEMKLLRDVGLADAANKPVSRRGPQLPAEIIQELERRGYPTK